jgi:hypothetical protein
MEYLVDVGVGRMVSAHVIPPLRAAIVFNVQVRSNGVMHKLFKKDTTCF